MMAKIEITKVVEEVVSGELSSGTKPWALLVVPTCVLWRLSMAMLSQQSSSVFSRLLQRQLRGTQLGKTQVAAKQAPLARPLERWIVPC